MNELILYIHGKNGSPEEAEHYKAVFAQSDVIGLTYHSQTPWEAKLEFPVLFQNARREYDSVTLVANSIGAYFAMTALCDENISRAFFISPIVDMEQLISDMMLWAKVTEAELRKL